MRSMQHVLLALVFGCEFCWPTSSESFPPEYQMFSGSLYASCKMRPNTQLGPGAPKVYGRVLLRQAGPEGRLKVSFRLKGLPDSKPRAIHIHQYGDLSDGCSSTGGHYNPAGGVHPHHPGDFGNLAPQKGRIRHTVESRATLFGGQSVLGRAVVIHEKEDDLGLGGDAGSLLHGNAGGRLACCVIGISGNITEVV